MSTLAPKTIATIDVTLLAAVLNRKVNSDGAFNVRIEYQAVNKQWFVWVDKFRDTIMEIDPTTIGKMVDMEKLADQIKIKLISVMTGESK